MKPPAYCDIPSREIPLVHLKLGVELEAIAGTLEHSGGQDTEPMQDFPLTPLSRCASSSERGFRDRRARGSQRVHLRLRA